MLKIALIFIFSNFQNDKRLGDPPLIFTVVPAVHPCSPKPDGPNKDGPL